MAIVFINGLTVSSCIGVYDWEKRIRQTLIFDIEMNWSIEAAAKDDDINKALDYSTVSEFVTSFAESRQFELIETLADRISDLIMQEFSVTGIRLTLQKPGAVKNAQTVGVKLEKGTFS